MKKLIFAAIVTILSYGSMAFAQGLQLGEPLYGGSGCPAGTVGSVLSPDEKALSILYDSYIVEAGPSVGRMTAHKSCNVAIPVRVPQGYSVSIIRVDYRGFASAPYGSSVQLNREYFFAGSRGLRLRSELGGHDDNYTITDNLVASAIVWTPCGASTTLRINTSIIARADRYGGDDVLATLDSTDVDTKTVYHIAWRRCY